MGRRANYNDTQKGYNIRKLAAAFIGEIMPNNKLSEDEDRRAIQEWREQKSIESYRTAWDCQDCGAQQRSYTGICPKCGSCALEPAVPEEGI
jgi:hypothetical protein